MGSCLLPEAQSMSCTCMALALVHAVCCSSGNGHAMQSDAKPAHELPLLYQAPMHTICEGSKAKSQQNARSACSASRHGTKEVGQKDSSCTAWPS